MKWLIDYDSTLADTHKPRIEAMNQKFGTHYRVEDFTTWSPPQFLEPEHDAWQWGTECFLNEDFQANCPPVEGAIEGMEVLLAYGDHPIIVSDRPPCLFEVTRDWLDRHGLDVVRLLFTRHKHSLNDQISGLTKLQAAWQYRLQGVIEDSPHHSLNLAQKEYIDRVYLLDMPYNQDVSHSKIQRVSSWKEIAF